MKKIQIKTKHFLLVLITVLTAQIATAQYSDLSAFTVQPVKKAYYDEKGAAKSETVDELYSFSFKDELFVHNIYKDGAIDKSQFYKISNKVVKMNADTTIYNFDCISGLSGNSFKYEIRISNEGKLIDMAIQQPNNGELNAFTGNICSSSSFKQE